MSGSRWQSHWNAFPRRFEEKDFLRQVGKTVGQKPVPPSQIERIVQNIAGALELHRDDRVIDLCCGNGLLTSRLAGHCRAIVGIDFSAPLIAIANAHNRPANVEYICQSALALPDAMSGHRECYNKMYLYEALQHFHREGAQRLLTAVAATANKDFRLFIGSIPDKDRLFSFYNTPDRRAEYERRVKQGTEAIGTWWRAEEVRELAAMNGFACQIRQQDGSVYTAHYRFDALLVFQPQDQFE